MIGVDWGTTSFRAFRLANDGTILDRTAAGCGIMHVPTADFAQVLRQHVGQWVNAGESHILLSGMIGSRQGWQEAAYLPCPAGADQLAANLSDINFDGAQVKLVPGLFDADSADIPDVMRGEETQLMGALATVGRHGLVCLPGTHSKWARIADHRVDGFTTHMSGEVYAAMRYHTILGRMMTEDTIDRASFKMGVARSAGPNGLLHHLFGVRTLTLTGQLAESSAASYLSGLLIGHEVRSALPPIAKVHLIGASQLCALYDLAIRVLGGSTVTLDQDAAATGLALIGAQARWQ